MRHWRLLVVLAFWPAVLDAATFTVTTTADSGAGSLRAAIDLANGSPGPDTIVFAIAPGGPQTITLASDLPIISEAVTIDGQTQPGFAGSPIVEVNGGGSVNAILTITSSGTTLRGLVINNYFFNGVILTGSAHVVEGSYIGTDAAGGAALGGGSIGVSIIDGTNIRIGGAIAAQRNVISGSNLMGVAFTGTSSANLVLGNYIGTNAAGTAAIANLLGIDLEQTASGNAIADNVISGNVEGITFAGAAVTNNVITGNRIGTNAAGTAALPNSNNGITIRNGAANNRIGGTALADRNLISGNANAGIAFQDAGTSVNLVQGNYIGTNLFGTAAIPNFRGIVLTVSAADNTIGGTVAGAGNVISGNTLDGIFNAVAGTLIAGNLIGTNAAGSAALPNQTGIFAQGAVNTIVGGTVAAARNVISGNAGVGILLSGAGTSGTSIIGNYIGTDISGATAVGNAQGGVGIFSGTAGNTVGGTTAAARNVISGNTTYGISIGFDATGTTVQGNYIGTTVTGAAALANTTHGVEIRSAINNTIGGTAAGAGNVISGNAVRGVVIIVTTTPASSNVVAGNLIGTNAAGNAAVPNYGGVLVELATANTIGGTAAGSQNVISGNLAEGVLLNFATGTQVQGNFIGTDSTGNASLGNGGSGVAIVGGGSNQVGGTLAGAANRIRFNGDAGVRVAGAGAGHAIRRNSIASQASLGIDLGTVSGVTPNDPGDGDTGTNALQNFPALTSASLTAGTTIVSGTLDSTPSTLFDIEIFDNAACDPSGHGEGLTFVGSTTVTTDGSGLGSFSVVIPGSLTTVTATATSPAGDTSEFSSCRTAAPQPAVTAINPSSGATGTVVTITGSGFALGATTVLFDAAPATSVSCVSTTQCTATAPAGVVPGTVNVRVVTTGGTSPDTPADDFLFRLRLLVVKQGQGTVTITTTVGPVTCGASCSILMGPGDTATLTAVASAGYRFGGWSGSGGCSGTGACQLTVTGDTAVVASFSTGQPSVSGFVYALKSIVAGTNQLHGFSVNSATGALTALSGSPIGLGTGDGFFLSEQLAYDRANGRLYAINGGDGTLNAFVVNRQTGGLTPMPFSPIALGLGLYTGVTVSPDGSLVAVAEYFSATVRAFKVSASTATAAPGGPFAVPSGSGPFGSAFSADGSYLYVGDVDNGRIAQFAVNKATGTLTPLVPDFIEAGFAATAIATDATGRVFSAEYGDPFVRAFTSSGGVLSPATANPFAADLFNPESAIVHPSGLYMVADKFGGQVGVFRVGGLGAATTLTAVPESPFFVNDLVMGLALDGPGTMLFVLRSNSINSYLVRPSVDPVLTLMAEQPPDALGDFLNVATGIAFAPRVVTLTVTQAGTGTGNVAISPAGVPCGPSCTAFDWNTTVSLTATPAPGYYFVGWSGGGCSGTGTCQIALTDDTGVSAIYAPLSSTKVTLQLIVEGQGTVTIDGTTSCGATCSLVAEVGSTASLTAVAAPGYTFSGWSGGGCSGTGACLTTLTANTTVTARFVLLGQGRVSLQIVKIGQGTVTINGTTSCGATCSIEVDAGTTVNLAASPAAGFVFAGWSGSGCSGTGGCVLNLTASTTVTARFGFSIEPATIASGSVGTPFSVTLSAAGAAPVSFSVGGTLPPGLTLSTSGALTGEPTAMGRFTFEVGAVDAGGATGSRIYSVNVNVARRVTTGAGEGGMAHVRTFVAGGAAASGALGSFFAYTPTFSGGVRVAVGDVTGDGRADVITAPGPGSAMVRVFDGVSGAIARSFDAFNPAPADGVYVAAGDVNGDGIADIVAGAGSGPPIVRVFDGRTGTVGREFLAEDPSFAGGVRVAAGDVNGDGWADIITGAGPGGSPRVGVYDSASGAQLRSFFAYPSGFTGGVYVAAGDVNGDGFADIVTGAGPGGGPHVRVFDGLGGGEHHGFFAFAPGFAGGVRVAAGDVNGDGLADVITGAGPGGGPHVRVWDGATRGVVDDFFAYEPSFGGGVFVAVPVPLNRAVVDTPGPLAAVGSPFQLAGWAISESGAAGGNGAAAIHAWAYPVGGGTPLFAGSTTLDGPRADVAALFGGQFAASGFNLAVTALPSGTYDVVVFVVGARSGTAIDRRIVRITVR